MATTTELTIQAAFQMCRDYGYSVLEEPKSAGKGICDWCEYEHILQEYMEFDDDTGLYDSPMSLCEGCVQDRNKFAKQKYEEAFAELKALKAENENSVSFDLVDDYIFGRLKDICREENLPHPEFCPAEITNELASALKLKEENEKLKAEIEEWKQADKKREQSKARKARKPKTEILNFDDANYEFYWAAQNGDVVFWKVPCELMDLEDESGGSRVVEAFQGCRFGEEWGSLSSHGIRTMDLKVLEENE
jgi:hypothetical protein